MRLTAISCAWVLGIFLGSKFHLPLAMVFMGLLPIPFMFFLKQYRKSLILITVCLFIFFGATFYFPFRLPPENQIKSFNNHEPVILKGVINSSPEANDTFAHIELSVQEINGQELHGKVLLFVPCYPEYHYGDLLSVKGKLEDPPVFEDFDYQAYLAQDSIYSTMLNPEINVLETGNGHSLKRWIISLRERLAESLASALPDPQASLAQGIVLGIRTTIPVELKQQLASTGTAHLLAISGINLSIIAGIMIAMGIWIFGRRHYIYVWLSLACIWFYAAITGLQAPVIRSAIMASVFLLAEFLGRQKHALPALAFSAAIMIAVDPGLLWNISFQLSFLAMVGLIFFAPFFQRLIRSFITSRLGADGLLAGTLGAITDSFSITLGAIIAVWPVISYHFGTISVISPLSTFLVAPALTPIIVLGALTAFLGLFTPVAAQAAGLVNWLFLSYMLWMIKVFAGISWAAIQTGTTTSHLVWLYYGVLGLVIWGKSQYQKLVTFLSFFTNGAKTTSDVLISKFTTFPKKLIIIPLLVLASLSALATTTLPDDNLHVSFLDVGEGDAILIQIEGRNILIDGGPSPQLVGLGLSQKLPFWERYLDLVILTHPHLDHLSGLIEVMKRYSIGQVLAPNITSTSAAYAEWMKLMSDRKIPLTLAQAGQRIRLSHEASLEILNPQDISIGDDEANLENNGIVAKLTCNKVSFLFTADIGKEAEAELISRRADVSCTVLKVAHHGSGFSTSSIFLSVAQPQISVISVSSDNTFGHPNAEVLDRLQNTVIYRTDHSGAVEFTTDGEKLWVKEER